MADRLTVVQVGLGPVGVAVARAAAAHPRLRLAGAADPRPDLAGRDLGEVVSGTPSGITVEPDAGGLLDRVRPAVVLHATGSFLPDVAGQLREIVGRGVSVVSTCEELAYPFHRHPDLSRELDALARDRRAVVVGSGVNPGFVMDKLVITLLGACRAPERVRVGRVVDASTRREPLQRKVGAGLSAEEFEAKKETGRFGHVGLVESARMIADVLELPAVYEVTEALRPRIAERAVATPFLRVEPGQVAGIDHRVVVRDAERERVRLELAMYVGAEAPADTVEIEAEPPIRVSVAGGVHGDLGTAATIVNTACCLGELSPGLRTMLDVPLRGWGRTRPGTSGVS